MSKNDHDTFYLGITMGGAVSAGAYTAGVMDYFFEVLDLWEKAKTGKLPGVDPNLVPKNKVIIDAMGGTSAGGMTTSMSAIYALENKIKPVTDKDVDKVGGVRDNIFYDSWVNLSETKESHIIDQILSIQDLKDRKIESLINSSFLDKIATKAFHLNASETKNPVENIPPYISKNIEMLISHTMLRGIPLEVTFDHANPNTSFNENPTHVSFDHFLFSHFRLSQKEHEDLGKYLALNPYDPKHRKRMLMSTIATGAFPIGLKYRQFDNDQFSIEYLKTTISRIITGEIGKADPDINCQINWEEPTLKNILKNYQSISIDGGAINNEPYHEVLDIIRQRCIDRGKAPVITIDNKDYHQCGLVMIDPFPDFAKNVPPYVHPTDINGVIPQIIKTLWDQSKVKRIEMVEQYSKNNSYRGYIFPTKKEKINGEWKGIECPIASASLAAFGGFLDIRFRHHDFYLGRNNARNYIRAFLSMPYDPENGTVHPIHKDWTKEMIAQFKTTIKGIDYLPIIPDINLILDGKFPTREEAHHYSIPEIPQLSKAHINTIKPKLRKRIRRMVNLKIRKILIAELIPKPPYTMRGIAYNIGKIFLGLIFGVTASIMLFVLYLALIYQTTKKAVKFIENDLSSKKLLSDD